MPAGNAIKNIQKDHFLLLDILKFFSAILIVFHHYQQDLSVRFPYINFFSGNIYFGYLVELFFIISGFLIAYDAEKYRVSELWTVKDYAKAWIRKAKRIYPMAILSCIVYLALANIYHVMSGKWPDEGVQFSNLWCIICSILLIFEGWPGNSMLGINGPAWYLCVLLICYILFYCVLYLSKKTRASKLFVFSLLFVLTLLSLKNKSLCPSVSGDAKRGYESFFLGVVMGCLLPHIDSKNCIKLGIAILCGSLLCCATVSCFGEMSFLFANQRVLCMTAFYPGLLFFSYGMKDLKSERLNYLGKLSFEIFLWHCPMFVLIKILCISFSKQINHSYWTMVLITGLIVLFSVFMLEKVEKPINKKLSNICK